MFTEARFYVSALRRHLNLWKQKESLPDCTASLTFPSHLLSSYARMYTEPKDLQSRKTSGVIGVVQTGSHPCFDKVQFNLRLNSTFRDSYVTMSS